MAGDPQLELAALIRIRGEPLLEALEQHALGARDHAEASAAYAFAAAVELGYERGPCEVVRELAMLHEIGLLYVPAALIATPAEQLDEEGRAALAAVPEAGRRLAHGAGLPDEACEWLAQVGERFDGAGPNGLAAHEIAPQARIVRAACACAQALAAAGGDAARAAETLRAGAGRELDPRIAEALTGIVARAAGH